MHLGTRFRLLALVLMTAALCTACAGTGGETQATSLSPQEEDLTKATSPAEQEEELSPTAILLERAKHCSDDCGGGETRESLLLKAIDLDPTFIEAYESLTEHYWSGQDEKAYAVCKRMEAALPDYSGTYYCLAYYGLVTDRIWYREYWRLLRKAIELDPGNAKARRRLAWGLHNGITNHRSTEPEKDLDEAIENYRIAMEIDPAHPAGRQGDSDITFIENVGAGHGRYEDSVALVEVFLDGLEKIEQSEDTCANLRRLLRHEGYSAFPSFRRRVLKNDQHCLNVNFEATRAIRAQQAGNIADAIELWEAQNEKNPFHEGVYLNLPKLYIETRQPDKARALINRYFEIDDVVEDRCEMRAKLVKQGYESFAPELFAQLKQECAANTQ